MYGSLIHLIIIQCPLKFIYPNPAVWSGTFRRSPCAVQEIKLGENSYKFFASKTAYDQVRNQDPVDELKFSGCTPKQFYFLSRHGTRYPSAKAISRMQLKLPEFRAAILQTSYRTPFKLEPAVLEALRNWNFTVKTSADSKLAVAGQKELMAIGTRYRKRFPFVAKHNFSTVGFNFMCTSAERTKDSMKYLLSGLFPDQVKDKIYENCANDKLLRFYELCGRSAAEAAADAQEMEKFTGGDEFIEMQVRLSDRLGLNYCPSPASVFVVYDICRYETAWTPEKTSPWCALFEQKDFKVLEYVEDLHSYYGSGYPHVVHYERACLVLKDIVEHFSLSSRNAKPQQPIAVLRISHSELIMKLWTRLGLFKDATPLRASNYHEQHGRKWRTSLIDAFATNLALVLLKCNQREKFRVASYFQEKAFRLPGCTHFPCAFTQFLKQYYPIVKSCNKTDACTLHKHLTNFVHDSELYTSVFC